MAKAVPVKANNNIAFLKNRIIGYLLKLLFGSG
jgi:hypothetical protein